MKLVGLAVVVGVGMGVPAQALRAQETAPAPIVPPHRTLQLRSASVYGVYYSNTLPATGVSTASSLGLGADFAVGGAIQVALSHTGPSSSFSLVYTPSFIGRIRYSSWNSLNHLLNFSGARRAGRWTISPLLAANISNYESYLFSPTAFDNVTTLSPNFGDLSAAVLGRSFENTELNSALGSASVAESPTRVLLYGQRVLTSTARVSTAYSYSPRLTVNFTLGAGRTQRLREVETDIAHPAQLIPTTTSGNVSLGISYSLSPRTQIETTFASRRVVSDLYDGYATTSLVSLGRTFASGWILQVRGGIGVSTPVRQPAARQSGTALPVGGGSLGYRSYSHTFLGSYDRTVNDPYGIGATTTLTSSASWRWERAGSAWFLDAGMSWQEIQGITTRGASAWRTTAGWGRRIGSGVALLANYAFLNYSGRAGAGFYRNSQSAIRVSLVWRTQPRLGR